MIENPEDALLQEEEEEEFNQIEEEETKPTLAQGS